MKIVIANKRINKLGGIERYLVELINNLSILDKDIKIDIYANEIDESNFNGIKSERIRFNYIEIKNKMSTFLSFIFCLKSTSRIKMDKDNRVIIHAHGTSTLNADIVTAHSCHKSWFMYSIKEVKDLKSKVKKILNPLHYLIMFIEKLQYSSKNLKKVIAISDVIKQELIDNYGLDENIIEVVYNGTNIEEFNPKNIQLYKNEVRKKHLIREDEVVLLFVAAEFKRKGLKVVLDAMSRLDENIKLLVVGGDKKDDFEAIISEYGMNKRVIFTGKTKDVYKYYAASDIFVFPTKYEAFGQVITEAMATGIPVITSRCSGAAELVEDRKEAILLNNPEDTLELIDKIQYLVKNKQVREEIGFNGRKKIEKYTWEKTSKEMINIYRNIYI